MGRSELAAFLFTKQKHQKRFPKAFPTGLQHNTVATERITIAIPKHPFFVFVWHVQKGLAFPNAPKADLHRLHSETEMAATSAFQLDLSKQCSWIGLEIDSRCDHQDGTESRWP
eukprot:3948803-Amphidinium_carterae.1